MHNLTIKGDIDLISKQVRFFRIMGIHLELSEDLVYSLLDQDICRALRLLWNTSEQGWWLYQEEYIDRDITTNEEFMRRLRDSRKVKC